MVGGCAECVGFVPSLYSLPPQTVASYVQCHGATAAARKFNIPPAVAAYYYRKEFKKQGGVSARRASISVHQQQQGMAGGDGTKVGKKRGRCQIGQNDSKMLAFLA